MNATTHRARTPRARTGRTPLPARLALLSVLALALVPAAAFAAPTAANYRLGSILTANGAAKQPCRGWSGDADDAGRTYMVCPLLRDTNGDGVGDQGAPALVELDTTGKVAKVGWISSDYYFGTAHKMMDVAVNPAGTVAYVANGSNIDNLGQNPGRHPYTGQPLPNGATTGSLLRMVRQGDGSWAWDPAWKAGPFKIGANYWSIRRVDVDAAGRVYVSANQYVYELSPANGAVVSAFGGATTNGPGGPWVDGIDVPQGLAVAADGRSILVVEQQHHLVQRWLRVGATDWTRDTSFLLGTPDQEGDDLCTTNDHFQSPYDVGVDAAGDVYVLDVTCNRIQRFTQTGRFVQTVWSWTSETDADLVHGFAVTWQGTIAMPWISALLTRLDPPGRPTPAPAPPPGGGGGGGGGGGTCTDTAAPKITAVAAPRRTTTRALTIGVTATDDCGVTHVRVVGPVTGSGTWSTGTSRTVNLTGWNGPRRLTVQVRDAKARTATRTLTVALALPQPRLVARTTVALAGRGCSNVAPMTRVPGAAAYRLLDRCARISGTVLSIRRAGGGTSLQLELPTAAARAIYANAVGPVKVWAITDRSTRVTRAVRVGRTATAVASIIALRNRSAAYVMPVDVLAGR